MHSNHSKGKKSLICTQTDNFMEFIHHTNTFQPINLIWIGIKPITVMMVVMNQNVFTKTQIILSLSYVYVTECNVSEWMASIIISCGWIFMSICALLVTHNDGCLVRFFFTLFFGLLFQIRKHNTYRKTDFFFKDLVIYDLNQAFFIALK